MTVPNRDIFFPIFSDPLKRHLQFGQVVNMIEKSKCSLQIDLNEFKLLLSLNKKTQLTLFFNSPSRKFYLSVTALVVNEMKKLGKIKSIPLQDHLDLLALLNESVGGAAGASGKENLLPRIYRKWKDALPDLEEAPLFKVIGRKKAEEDGGVGKIYSFTDAEKDAWANLFDYTGSDENVRLRFAIDKIGVTLEEISIIFGDSLNGDAWDRFISSLEKAEIEKSDAKDEIPLPADWPSIAVLPFANMSEDPKQEFLGDAITESIITALSKVPRLFVIARTSTFIYRGKPMKIKQVGEDLGVRYVLEGSVQRSGNRVRVISQLIDALTGNHIWAERYERDLKDVFALQDEITLRILTAIRMKLTDGEQASLSEGSYGKYLRTKQGFDSHLKELEAIKYMQGHNIEDVREARRLAEEAVAMCPESPTSYVTLGYVHLVEYWTGAGKSLHESIEKGIGMAQKALSMDDSLSGAHTLLGNLYAIKREYDKAIAEGERAVALAPGSASALGFYGQSLTYAGQSEKAIPMIQKAIRLNPFTPTQTFLFLGHAFRMTRRYEEAVSAFKKAVQRAPENILAHLALAGTYSMMGQEKEARAEAAEVLRINPKFSLDNYSKLQPHKDQSETDKYINALRKTGLK